MSYNLQVDRQVTQNDYQNGRMLYEENGEGKSSKQQMLGENPKDKEKEFLKLGLEYGEYSQDRLNS